MKLVDGWRSAYRLWSIQLAAAAAAIATAIVANPNLLLGLIGLIPEGKRGVVAFVAGLVTFVLPALTRLVEQPSKPDDGPCP